MWRKLFISIICFSFFQFSFAQSMGTEKIKALVDTITANKSFNGVILYAEEGKTVYEKAIGYRTYADKKGLKKTDVFELASVSKQFCALVIMQLKEKGLLQYDDLVEKYLDIPYKGITIRNLLTHTSGLPDYQQIMDQNWDKTKVANNNDIIAYLNKFHPPILFSPGEKYTYSNTGYVLLASIAEKACGRDFIEYCNAEIFQKLGMKHTAIRTLEEKAAVKNFAIGHMYASENRGYVRADSFPSSNYTIWLGNRKGPGRISSTAQDLLKWDNAIRNYHLVSKETMQEAYQPMKLNNGKYSNYGFGLELVFKNNALHLVWHNGDNPGYKTLILRDFTYNQTLILLTNNDALEMNALIGACARIIDKEPLKN
ncbi:MAG: serine hydrolase [Bacteroidetes bacterium]|nr:serine hydrolase [Bacteroidota bacterium]